MADGFGPGIGGLFTGFAGGLESGMRLGLLRQAQKRADDAARQAQEHQQSILAFKTISEIFQEPTPERVALLGQFLPAIGIDPKSETGKQLLGMANVRSEAYSKAVSELTSKAPTLGLSPDLLRTIPPSQLVPFILKEMQEQRKGQKLTQIFGAFLEPEEFGKILLPPEERITTGEGAQPFAGEAPPIAPTPGVSGLPSAVGPPLAAAPTRGLREVENLFRASKGALVAGLNTEAGVLLRQAEHLMGRLPEAIRQKELSKTIPQSLAEELQIPATMTYLELDEMFRRSLESGRPIRVVPRREEQKAAAVMEAQTRARFGVERAERLKNPLSIQEATGFDLPPGTTEGQAIDILIKRGALRPGPEGGKERTLVEAINSNSIGLVGNVNEFLARTLGQVIPEAANRQAVADRTLLRQIQQDVVQLFRTAGRVAIEEQRRIMGFVPRTGVFESVPSAQEALRELVLGLEAVREKEDAVARDPAQPAPSKAEARRNIASVNRILKRIGDVRGLGPRKTTGLEKLSDEELLRQLQETVR